MTTINENGVGIFLKNSGIFRHRNITLNHSNFIQFSLLNIKKHALYDLMTFTIVTINKVLYVERLYYEQHVLQI